MSDSDYTALEIERASLSAITELRRIFVNSVTPSFIALHVHPETWAEIYKTPRVYGFEMNEGVVTLHGFQLLQDETVGKDLIEAKVKLSVVRRISGA